MLILIWRQHVTIDCASNLLYPSRARLRDSGNVDKSMFPLFYFARKFGDKWGQVSFAVVPTLLESGEDTHSFYDFTSPLNLIFNQIHNFM